MHTCIIEFKTNCCLDQEVIAWDPVVIALDPEVVPWDPEVTPWIQRSHPGSRGHNLDPDQSDSSCIFICPRI